MYPAIPKAINLILVGTCNQQFQGPTPPKFNSSPLKRNRNPTRRSSLPSTISSGSMLKLWGVRYFDGLRLTGCKFSSLPTRLSTSPQGSKFPPRSRKVAKKIASTLASRSWGHETMILDDGWMDLPGLGGGCPMNSFRNHMINPPPTTECVYRDLGY